MTVPQTDTKTDTKLWFWGSFRNAPSSLDYSVEGAILTLQTRQTQPDSVPRLHADSDSSGIGGHPDDDPMY
jgi:hypothetical protein